VNLPVDAHARVDDIRSATRQVGFWRVLRVLRPHAASGLSFGVAVGFTVASTVAGIAFAALATDDDAVTRPAAALVSGLTAQLACWSAGLVLIAGSASAAFLRDHDAGVRDLLSARGVPPNTYLVARMLATCLWSAGISAAGPVLVTFITLRGAEGAHATATVLWSLLGTILYIASFCASITALAYAVFAARAGRRSLVTLLLIVGVPELLAPVTRQVLPREWCSIPAALGVLREGLSPFAPNLRAVLGGLAPLAVVTVAAGLYAITVLRRQVRAERAC
jgi:hypothetical protein